MCASFLLQLPFKEVRYLAGAENLQKWCDFGSLLPANPALSGASKCLSAEEGEVKFVSAIWVCFSFAPTNVKPRKRLELYGWMSTAHWNGSKFRSGERSVALQTLTANEDACDPQVDERENLEMSEEFGAMVTGVEDICRIRMLAKNQEILDKKLKKFKKQMISTESPLM